MNEILDNVSNPTDRLFLRLRNTSRWSSQRELLTRLWHRYKPYADAQFLAEIGHNFYARFWEMSLASELLDQEFELVPMQHRPSGGPDICIAFGDDRVWIEAIAPGPGTGDDAVDFSEEEGGFVPEPNIVLRYQGAIKDKHEKLGQYRRNGIVSDGERFIIAICGRRIPAAAWEDDIPYAAQAVFPFGPYTVRIDTVTKEVVDQRYAYRPFIEKISGSEVPTTSFLDPEFSDVAALISGNPDPIEMTNPPLTLIHNPKAGNPMPMGWLKRGIEYWLEENTLRHRNLSESV